MRKYCLLFLAILFTSCYTYGQLYPIIHWQIKNNLNIRANITSITQDKQGFIWHARGNKLYKIENENLYEQNRILGIEKLIVDYAISDKKGQLWIAADSALYLVKNGKAAKILKMQYRYFSEKSQTITENPDGNIVLCGDDGAYKITKDTVIIYSDKNNLYRNSGTSGSNFINHKQYITSYGGLFELHKNKFLRHLIVPDTFDRKNDFRTITKFKNKILVGTAQGLYEFANGSFLPVTTTIEGNTNPTVNQAIVTSDQNLWLATQNGILIYDGITWTSITEKNGLRDLKCTQLFEDNHHRMWVATEFHISCLLRNGMSLENLKTGFASSNISRIMMDRQENLWVGSNDRGFGYKAKGTNEFKWFGDPSNYGGWSISSFYQLSNSDILVTPFIIEKYIKITDGLKLNVINTTSTKINSLEDENGTIWMGSFWGIEKIKNNKVEWIDPNTLPQRFNNFYSSYRQGKKLWWGSGNTAPSGLLLWDNNSFKHFGKSNGLDGKIVLSITEHPNKKLLACTHNGVFIENNGQFQRFPLWSKEHDNMYITSILFQNDSIIWYGSPDHIFKWDIKNKSLRAYNSEIDIDFQYGVHESAIAKDKSEKMYFGSSNGLITYDPKTDFLKVTAPETQITKFDLYNMGNDSIGNYSNTITYNGIPQNIKLPYNKNNIKIEFIGIDYSYPCKFDCLEKYEIHYSYKLEGYDKQWRTTTDKKVIFSALPPGTYTFLLKAKSSEGIWNKKPQYLSFIISPPWWQTWWYYVSQITVLIALIFITIYFNHSQSQTRIATILAFVTLLIVIEFLAFHVEAYFESFTGEIPLYKLGVNLVLALLVSPVEKMVDRWVTKNRMH